MAPVFVGVDVGTGSARAGLFDATGRLIAAEKHVIETWREPGEIVEQSSDDIWSACAAALGAAMKTAGVTGDDVAGIGFDATCSLVALDAAGRPATVSPSGDPRRNVIVWMDHRAVAQAQAINDTADEVLDYVGGAISPEMEMPKLLWLKTHLPAAFAAATQFFDLTDFLGWRATGSAARSVCTVTCKWGYLAHENRWSDAFLSAIGLGELADQSHARIGSQVVPVGAPLGRGLTEAAAGDLGLRPGTPVGAGLIDAHAGGLGTLGGRAPGGAPADPTGRLGYIFGTSACIMASTTEPKFVPGVWGPHFSAMVPGLWLNEGGQSAAGAAIDHLVRSHGAYPEASAKAAEAGLGLLDYLEARIRQRSPSPSEAAFLARDRHVVPDFIGNRSPHADPHARGAVIGLTLDHSIEDLECSYVAGLCGIACGLAEVVDALRQQGIACRTVVASGGASHSVLARQILADTTGMTVVLPETGEPVLLGAAMVGAVASHHYPSITAAMAAMSRDGASTTVPASEDTMRFHAAKRQIFRDLERFGRTARATMAPYR